jgi:DNA-binding NarL/FixJ family response regulator
VPDQSVAEIAEPFISETGAADRVRVLVCEAEPLVRAGLRTSLRDPDVEVVGEVESIRQLMASVVRPEVDVVLMGSVPTAAGRIAVADVSARLRCRIVVMLRTTDRDALLPYVQSGIRGFVASHSAPADVSQAVRSVASNGAYLSPALARHLLDWLADRLGRQTVNRELPTGKLSGRESEVLGLLGSGRSNAEISRILRIRETTVRSHVYHILAKLNLRSRTEAVLYGFQHGLRSAE